MTIEVMVERDMSTSEEFLDKNASLPTVIVLNDQHNYGSFIPVSTMARCGWINFDEKQLVSHTFRSGAEEQGILVRNPRMLVCPKTDLYQYDLKASKEQQTKVIVGLYNAELKDNLNIKTERLYLVFFLDDKNQPLHTTPLKYAGRGVNGATFELERRVFKAEIEACHAITNQVPAKPRNDLFHALSVFCFTTKAELAGDRQKAWVCPVVGHEKPTTENWKSYFVGFGSLKEYAWSTLEPGQKIDILSSPALAGGEEMVALRPAASELHLEQATAAEEANTKASLIPTTVPALVAVGSEDTNHPGDIEDTDPDIPF